MICSDSFTEIANKTPQKLSLYIHIPFCTVKCGYCDFYSVPLKENLLHQYLQKLSIEIRAFSDTFKNIPLRSIFIGGGSPSIITSNDILTYLNFPEICNMSSDCEVSIEVNPEQFSFEKIQAYRTVGINRISMGIQSFEETLLATLDRSVGQKKILQSADLLADKWGADYSFDFMYGTPGQTIKTLLSDLHKAVSFSPKHISFYNLTVEENTTFHAKVDNGTLTMPTDSSHTEMHLKGKEFLESHSFIQYEVSNYCQPGFECRHNVGYWNMDPYIGIGPSAASTIPNTSNAAVRIEGNRNLISWLKDSNNYVYENLDANSFLLENVMMAFRMNKGLNKKLFRSRFTTDLDDLAPNTITRWKESGALAETDASIHLTAKGQLFLDSFISDLYKEFPHLSSYKYS